MTPAASQGYFLVRYVGALAVAVETPNGRVGFIEAAGTVFVALRGARYDHSVEVGQALTVERALNYLLPDARAVSDIDVTESLAASA